MTTVTAAEKERSRIRSARYRAKHPEKARASQLKYRAANPDRITAYYKLNKEKKRTDLLAWRAKHRARTNANAAAWRAANPEKMKTITRKARLKRYGITLEQYQLMLAQQHERCAICKRHQSEFKRALSVDHNHSTHAVRELLCHPCNTALGSFRDNLQLFEAAVAYLRKHSTVSTNKP